MDLRELSLETFEPLLGATFTALTEPRLALTLSEATPLPAGPDADGRAPFSLLFSGPGEPTLPQGMVPLEHAGLGTLEIFLVPLGPGSGGFRYEAIFS